MGQSWNPEPFYWYAPGTDTWTLSNASSKGSNTQSNVPLAGFQQGGTTYLLTADHLHRFDAAADDFVLIDRRHPSWPECFKPELFYRADPGTVTPVVLDDKVVLVDRGSDEGFVAENRTHILSIKP